METKIKEFVQARSGIELAKAKMKSMLDAVKTSIEYQQFEAFVAAEIKLMDALEDEIKLSAVNKFKAEMEQAEKDGALDPKKLNKKPWEGVNIQEKTVITFPDDKTLEYCEEHQPDFITKQVDKKGFTDLIKVLAKKKMVPDFVKIEVIPTATIASDLSMYLDGE